MTTNAINISTPNQITDDPTLRDLLNLFKKEIFIELNCHHLATIQSFNSTLQTCNATINYPKTIIVRDSKTGLYNPISKPYPLLQDIPVFVLGGGATNLTFPIQQGDQCLLLFNDRNISNWFETGLVGPVANTRAHNLADGLALVGIRQSQNPLSNYDNTRATLRNGTTGIGVNTTQIKIYNAINGSLGPNFTAFFAALAAFMASCEASSDPTLVAAATAFLAALNVPVAPSALGATVNIEGILE